LGGVVVDIGAESGWAGIVFEVAAGAGIEVDSLTGGTISPVNKSDCDMFANHSWLE